MSDWITCFTRRRRNLPHFEEPGATYFVTFNLDDRQAVNLVEDGVAPVIISTLQHFDDVRYWLYDYVVMPDHVHAIIKVFVHDGRSEPLHRITHSLKSYTAHEINKRLQRQGHVWQLESHDHIIRNREDFEEKAQYIFANPYRRELVSGIDEWPWWGQGKGK